MNKMKAAHWVFTGLISLLLLGSASMYIMKHDEVAEVFVDLHFPVWLLYPMAIAKFAGVATILTKFNKSITEWAYAGIFFNMLLALGAHLDCGDNDYIAPLVALILTLGSYFTWKKMDPAK